ncbi:hypothetical protein GGI21_003912 [Coemansia aciculifera]|nr:hypothetical protein GGI21_003912 [Coemansia aciculifera]
MARSIFNVGIFIFATVVVVANAAPAAPAASSAPAPVRGMVMAEYNGGGWGGDEYGGYGNGCCGEEHDCCDHHECCCCHHKAPEVTVHVVQPPPTFIYDVTQTACYTEHHDCCHCPYVCGPTCIPQGEVLAPANVGRRVAISHGSGKGYGKNKKN